MSNDATDQLGINVGTAAHRLRKLLLWRYVVAAGDNICFRCGKTIESIDDLSIDHVIPWRHSGDPARFFFDLGNVRFSHLGCNSASARRTKGKRFEKGHIPSNRSNLTEREAREIYRLGKSGCGRRQLARDYSISHHLVYDILRGRSFVNATADLRN